MTTEFEPAPGTSQALSALSTAELLRLSRGVLSELRSRGAIRSANAPAGDYGEYLVQLAYNGTLASASTKSWDVLTQSGKRIQVKTRVVGSVTTRTGLSPFRSFEFDFLVVVLLDATDMSVVKAVEIPVGLAEAHATRSTHVNGSVVSTAITQLVADGVVDITERLRQAAVNA